MTSVILASCSTAYTANEVVTRSKGYCVSLVNAKMLDLQIESRIEVVLDSSSDIYKTEFGYAYFVGFKLPPRTKTLEFQAMYGGLLPSASFIDPIVIHLDREMNVLREIQNLPLTKGFNRAWGGAIREYYAGTQILVPDQTAFVVVVANPHSERRFLTYSDSGKPWELPANIKGTIAVIAR